MCKTWLYYTPKPLRNTPFSDSVRLKFNLTLFLFCNLSFEGYLAVTLLIGRYINELRLTPTHPLRKENYSFNMLKAGADLGLILTDFLNEEPREQASRGAPGNFFLIFFLRKFPFSGFCLMPGNWKKKTFVQTIFQKVLLLLFYY